MNIPQVNAGATDRNRDQTKRICELKELLYRQHEDGIHKWTTISRKVDGGWEIIAELPNGSFTLCQVVGMLKAEGIEWRLWPIFATHYRRVDHRTWGWGRPIRDGSEVLIETGEPYDLTAAMDARIKVLEEKK